LIKSTWHEEPEKRPSFTDIVEFFHEQNIQESPVDEATNDVGGNGSDSGYLELSSSH